MSCSYLKYRTIINNKDAPAILCFWPAWRRTVHRRQGFTPVLTIIKVLRGGAAPHPRKGCLVGSMVPSCFAPSRRFGPPYSQPPRFPKELRTLVLVPLWLAALALAFPLGVAILSALFG